MKNVLIAGLVLALGGGCRMTRPGESGREVEPVEAARTLALFGASVPRRYEAVCSVVLARRRQETMALGVVSVDGAARRFALSAVSPMGLKLFDLVGEGDHTAWVTAIPGMKSGSAFAHALANDLRRAYFDPMPLGAVRAWREGDRMVFSTATPEGAVEHVFERDRLVEKRCFEGRRLVTRVEFADYEEREGRLYARSVGVTNPRLGYRLIVRVKELHPGDAPSGTPR